MRLATVIGGEDSTKQGAALAARPHFVVATPGRLAEHVRYAGAGGHGDKSAPLARVATLVLDEVSSSVMWHLRIASLNHYDVTVATLVLDEVWSSVMWHLRIASLNHYDVTVAALVLDGVWSSVMWHLRIASLNHYDVTVVSLVLDEADRLLAPCFQRDLALVLRALPPARERQTLLFSATMTPSLARAAALAARGGGGGGGRSGGGAAAPPTKLLSFDLTTRARLPARLRNQYLFMPDQVI